VVVIVDIGSRIILNNGLKMPCLGLGVYLVEPGKETLETVAWALEAGYRLIDTASCYNNELEVGKAVRSSSIPREDVFVTTKLWNTDHGHDRAVAAFEESLDRLGLDYIDLYLVHWPVESLRKETWHALQSVYRRGLCRALGVSNFTIPHLEDLLSGTGVVPAVNQVEFTPYLYQRELLEYCRDRGICLQAYSPLTRGKKFSDPRLVEMARRYRKAPTQVLIRWVLQHGASAIPKSSNRERIIENSLVFDFEICDEDMLRLDSFNEDLRLCWDPTEVQ
jgi:diketogulonate reductase-like aldo/keto reductase